MYKTKKIVWIVVIFISLSSFAFHKFYSGIFQIEHNNKKKRIEITSHLFVDDVNVALQKKFGKKYNMGTADEKNSEWTDLKKYIETNFHIWVNGKEVKQQIISKEYTADEIILYAKVENVSAIKSLKVSNTILIDEFPKQQNTIHVKFNNKKQSVVLKDELVSKTFN